MKKCYIEIILPSAKKDESSDHRYILIGIDKAKKENKKHEEKIKKELKALKDFPINFHLPYPKNSARLNNQSGFYRGRLSSAPDDLWFSRIRHFHNPFQNAFTSTFALPMENNPFRSVIEAAKLAQEENERKLRNDLKMFFEGRFDSQSVYHDRQNNRSPKNMKLHFEFNPNITLHLTSLEPNQQFSFTENGLEMEFRCQPDHYENREYKAQSDYSPEAEKTAPETLFIYGKIGHFQRDRPIHFKIKQTDILANVPLLVELIQRDLY